MNCNKCGFAIFDGAASYAGPQCRCWARYNPAPNAEQSVRCVEAKPLTEQRVREIIREEIKRAAQTAGEGV